MLKIGKYNELEVVKRLDFGLYLKSDELEILLPIKYVAEGTNIGDILNVFIYKDSEDRIIATTLTPYAIVDEFAFLRVKQVNQTGAFLDWGIEKDLLVPFREQGKKMEEGRKYVVRIYLDHSSERIAASALINKFVEKENIDVQQDDLVELLIAQKTDMGFNAIINNEYMGLLFNNEIFEDIRVGDRVKGYVKRIREDKKIDLSLQKSGYDLVDVSRNIILKILKENNGFLSLNDKSSPGEIIRLLKMSKKSYKKSIGSLYKEKIIEITDEGIRLI